MSADVAARAFDPFLTTKPLGEGTGLGPSMIYGFARRTGGPARIHSEVKQGTMVCLFLPRRHGQDAGDAAALGAGTGPEGLEVLRSDARVDLLVTDVGLPGGLPGGLNGRQVADAPRALRSRCCSSPATPRTRS